MSLAKGNISQNAFWLVSALLIPAIIYAVTLDFKFGLLIIAGIIALSLVVVCFTYPVKGFYITITIALTIRIIERIYGTALPVGTVVDVLVYSVLLGWLVKRKSEGEHVKVDYLRDPLIILQYVQMLYLILEIANPDMYSVAGWGTFARVNLRFFLIFLIAVMVFNSMADVRKFFKFWLTISTLAAFYGCIQGIFGLMPFEVAFNANMASKINVVVVHGLQRSFSFMSDPAVFGLLMAAGAIICMVLLTASMKTIGLQRKLVLIIALLLHLVALGYSGTRTGYVILPIGLFIFLLVNLHNRNTIIAALIFTLVGCAMIFGPFYHPTIIRIRTAFVGSKDESLNVRDVNRHRVQPYIYRHPIGGGIFTVGPEGETFNPGHPLAGFPPDSGYMRTVLEMGWIGLILMCLSYFVLLRYSIANYFKSVNELDGLLLISISAVLFAIIIAQFAQEAGGLMESAAFFNILLGITIKVKYIYKKQKNNLV